ncbi:MAG: hypothetical protein ACRDV4_11540 [Acidimicrobiales bacterium]
MTSIRFVLQRVHTDRQPAIPGTILSSMVDTTLRVARRGTVLPKAGYRWCVEPPSGTASPPDDPEDWSDEQWIEFLEATDDSTSASEPQLKPRPRHPGGVLGAAMLGLRDAIYGPPDDEAAVVVESPGAPPSDDRLEVHLDLDHPERSTVVVHAERARPAPRAGSGADEDETDPDEDRGPLR